MGYNLGVLLSSLSGGIGLTGRFMLALVILAVLKFFNAEDKETDRGIKLLLILGLVVLIVIAAGRAFIAGLYLVGFAMPLEWMIDFMMW